MMAASTVALTAVASLALRPAAQVGGAEVPVVLMRVPDGGLQPQLAVDAQGTVHLVYFKGEAANGDVMYARLSEDGAALSPTIRVNSQAGSAIATGNIRGAHLALGKSGRVHVSWFGSGQAAPRAPGGTTPVLYTRMNTSGTGFEPQRNVVRFATELDGATVAADKAGNVYVAWHGSPPGSKSEGDRRVWISRSSDDGATFTREQAASNAATGACGCCGLASLVDRDSTLYVLYRSARDVMHRDAYVLTSKNAASTFGETKLQEWTVGTCPMSTFALTDASDGVQAAWETAGQVYFAAVDSTGRPRSRVVEAPGPARSRKHPSIAVDARGNVLLAWTEDMGWGKGGVVAWQVFDKNSTPQSAHGRREGVPAWSLVAAYPRPGGFTILY